MIEPHFEIENGLSYLLLPSIDRVTSDALSATGGSERIVR